MSTDRNWQENIHPGNAAYRAVHGWIRNHFGSACQCENKDCQQKSIAFHWSNISGWYKRDRSDWQQLCVSCHKNFDNNRRRKLGLPVKALKTRCKRGHAMIGDNLRMRKNAKYSWHYCYACMVLKNKSRDRRKMPLTEGAI